MNDELLPPNPSVDGWYWATVSICGSMTPIEWRRHLWMTPIGALSPETAWRTGYRLVIPHPIPTPEQLDALHALERLLDNAQSLAPDGRVLSSVLLCDLRAALGQAMTDVTRTATLDVGLWPKTAASAWHVVVRQDAHARPVSFPEVWCWDGDRKQWRYKRLNYRNPVEAWRSGWRIIVAIPGPDHLWSLAYTAEVWAKAQESGDSVPGKWITDAKSFAALISAEAMIQNTLDCSRILEEIRERLRDQGAEP